MRVSWVTELTFIAPFPYYGTEQARGGKVMTVGTPVWAWPVLRPDQLLQQEPIRRPEPLPRHHRRRRKHHHQPHKHQQHGHGKQRSILTRFAMGIHFTTEEWRQGVWIADCCFL